jgi:NifU-like protein
MWNYSDKVWERIRSPRNVGDINDPTVVAEVGNLACGDALKLYLKLDQAETIVDAKYQTFGCGSAIASGSALTELIIGKSIHEAAKLTNDDIADFLGGLPEEKMHCSVMGMEAMQAAYAKYTGKEVPTLIEGTIVCKCFGITEEKIRDAIRRDNLTTVDQVTHYTKAGGGCGQCKPRIEEIIAEEVAARRAAPPAPERPRRLTNIQRMRMVEDVLERQIAPLLKADGGDIELVDIDGDHVYVALRGACAMCVASGATIAQVVQAKLRELVDESLVVEEAEA